MVTNKLWLVARYEYLKAVRRRSFLLATIGIPLVMVAVIAFIGITSTRAGAEGAVGYVDLAGFVTPPADTPPAEAAPSDTATATADTINFVPYASQAEAEAALQAKTIEAFYVIQPDYLTSGRVSAFFLTRAPSDRVQEAFVGLLAAQLVAGLPAQEQERVVKGPAQVVSQELGRQVDTGFAAARFILPIVIGFLFVIAVMSSSGYLLQAVTDEKENRTIEVMATSLSPEELIVGKSAGLIAVALTQVVIWVALGVAGLLVLGHFFESLRSIPLPWGFLGLTALFFLPAFVLEAGMITAVGAAVTDLRQGQQITGIMQFIFFIPFFFFPLALSNPDHPILVALTLFPPTSFFSIAMRWGATSVPWWQIALAWVLLAAGALAMLQVAPRVFRRGMLRYGQHMQLKGVWEAARSRG